MSFVFLYREARRAFRPGRHFLRVRFFVSKQERHSTIRHLVAAETITSQDELRRRLAKRGFDVTQATLSRDIHELRIFKGPAGYSTANGNGLHAEVEDEPAVDEILGSFGIAVRQAQNQLVLRTTSGGAQPVALAIDHEAWSEVVGTLAGDDTILIVCPDNRRATALREKLERMIR